jgi:hypothetical protein
MAIIDDALDYLQDAFGPTYDAWTALDTSMQQKTLNQAARYLNVLPWQGTPTGPLGSDPASLVWPRTGVTVDGVAIDSLTTPSDVTHGQFELAVLINTDPTLPGKLDQGSNIQAANAGGGTGVTFFAPTSARQGTATVLPVIVQRLVGKYLAMPDDAGSFGASGKSCSAFRQSAQFGLSWPEE